MLSAREPPDTEIPPAVHQPAIQPVCMLCKKIAGAAVA
jgi:hypothetical protein